jgi:hypothetical protein
LHALLRTKMAVWGGKVHAVHAVLAVSSQLSAEAWWQEIGGGKSRVVNIGSALWI